MKFKALIAALLIGVGSGVWSQPIPNSVIQDLHKYLYEELSKKNFVKLNRVTRQGDLSSCEVEFTYSYRDHRARGGAPVMLSGSFSSTWNPGKLPGFMYKINAEEPDIAKGSWSVTAPPYMDVIVNGQTFKPYRTSEFVCESGGRCAGYADSKLELNLKVAMTDPFDATIVWSLAEGGMDHSVALSRIGSPELTALELRKFTLCNDEVLKKLVDHFRK